MDAGNVRGGQKLNRSISASEWNELRALRSKLQKDTGAVTSAPFDGARDGIVLVRNQSGQSLKQYDVVGLSEPVISPDANLVVFQGGLTLDAVVPTDDHVGKFGILLAPCASGGMAPAVISGITAAKLSITSAEDEFADVSPGDKSRLKSGSEGAAQILWKPDPGTSDVWCIVRIGNKPQVSTLRWAICAEMESDTAAANPCDSAVREPDPSRLGHSCPWVLAIPCDNCAGDNPDTSNPIDLTLPTRQCFDFSLRFGDVVGWLPGADGSKVIVTDTSKEIQHFVLTEELLLGGEALAELICYSDGVGWVGTGITIRVFDWTDDPEDPAELSGTWRGDVGYRGLCRKRCTDEYDTGEVQFYDIIWMQRKAEFIRFSLIGPLVSGEATATVTGYAQGVDPGETVTVLDPDGLFLRALAGAVGSAFYDDVQDKYVVMVCTTQAGLVEISLNEDLGSGTSETTSATVTGHYGTQQDVDAPGGETGADVEVVDEPGLFPRALSGALGVAAFDNVAGFYRLLACQQLATRVRGTIPSSLSPCGLLTSTSDFEIDGSSLTPLTFSPFNQQPVGTQTVKNEFGWSAAVGATFFAEVDPTVPNTWTIYQAETRCTDPEDC